MIRIAVVSATVLVSVFSCQFSAVAATARKKTPTPGRLIIQRAPNFGTNLVAQVWIDGRKIANIPRDHHYGGMIPAGRHSITILALPNSSSRRPTSIRLGVKPGKTYLYTAAWSKDRLILQPSTLYVHTQAVKPIGR